jgi:hypothetical protein
MAIQYSRNPIVEAPTPAPDGVETTFQTSQNYKSGTVAVWKNGIRKVASWDDGWVELGGNQIAMKEAPLTGDSLEVRYDPA